MSNSNRSGLEVVLSLLTSQDVEEVLDNFLHGAGVAALLRQVLHGLNCLLHQQGIVGFQLACNNRQYPLVTQTHTTDPYRELVEKKASVRGLLAMPFPISMAY